MLRKGLIEEYQSFQSQPGFQNTKYIVSFIGGEKNTATFYGLYLVNSISKGSDLPLVSSGLSKYFQPSIVEKTFFLKLQEVKEYCRYKDRLVIDWLVPRVWYNEHGKVMMKPVIRILPYRFVSEFPGLMNIKISFSELKAIFETPDSHEEWYNSLTRLQAVYLIQYKKEGLLYVGTTFGKNGLWQRWESYVKSGGTGGNKRLIELKNSDPEYTQNLQFSILEVLTRTADKSYCIHKESLWKEKLGTRAFGLNEN